MKVKKMKLSDFKWYKEKYGDVPPAQAFSATREKLDKNFRERYKRIVASKQWKDHYENKSLGEVIDIVDENIDNPKFNVMQFISSQKDLPPEFGQLIFENFWDLLNDDCDKDKKEE